MFATFYFPYLSTLTYPSIPSALKDLIYEGNIKRAAVQAARLVDTATAELTPELLQLHGDLQSVIGMDIDAEESYRDAQKITYSKDQLSIRSCRNAGWQALFRGRYGTAMSCFVRLSEQQGSEVPRFEGLFGICSIFLAFGRLREADNVLNALEESIDNAGSELHNLHGWRELLSAVRFDVSTQCKLRSHAELADHVYWQSALGGESIPSMNTVPLVQTPLLRARSDFLYQMMLFANGQRDLGFALGAHADWAGKQSMGVYQRAVRIEIVLASFASGATAMGEGILNRLNAEARTVHGHGLLDYLYCVAKLHQQQERFVEASRVYMRYALTSMRCIRDEADALAGYAQRNTRAREQLDYIAARLPVRYRRAYRYLVDHLDRKDLSVREIADEVGVTQRALQSAFKRRLGSTPSEIIRRLRMERIRAELQGSYGSHEGILETANKWGVSSRSTLINNYRREFNETPSTTLNR